MQTPSSYTKCLFGLIISILTSATCLSQSALENIYWSGKVTSVYSFAENAVPAGVSSGALVHGVYSVDPSASTHLSYIEGSIVFGEQYRFTSGLSETISIGSNTWQITGGDLTFYQNYGMMDVPGSLAYDVFSTSETATYMSIPKDAGYTEVGFAFFDNTVPYGLFDQNAGGVQAPDLTAVTSANGFISSRLFDSQYNLVDGYYINFDITSASSTTIPEPSLFSFAVGVVSLAFVFWRRFRALS